MSTRTFCDVCIEEKKLGRFQLIERSALREHNLHLDICSLKCLVEHVVKLKIKDAERWADGRDEGSKSKMREMCRMFDAIFGLSLEE